MKRVVAEWLLAGAALAGAVNLLENPNPGTLVIALAVLGLALNTSATLDDRARDFGKVTLVLDATTPPDAETVQRAIDAAYDEMARGLSRPS